MDKPHDPKLDLGEATTRNRNARRIVGLLSAASLAPDEVFHHLEVALADTPHLIDEIIRLRALATSLRLDRANLAAAARATIAAHHDGEADPLAYLRDELYAQGFRVDWGRR